LHPFVEAGGGALVAVLLFWFPLRRRRWQSMLGLLLLTTLAVVASGCGVSKSLPITKPGSGGTTAGAYTITVTGTSGAMQSTTSVPVTVQ
jgi:uncharacterized protein YceK